MTGNELTTSWTWLDDGEVRGLTVDVGSGQLRWYDQIGCHCTDEDYLLQTIEEFRQGGCPPLIGVLPVDIAEELAFALSAV